MTWPRLVVYVVVMTTAATDGSGTWILNENLIRWAFVTLATLIGIATIQTRGGDALDWSLVPPTVATFWIWAAWRRFPIMLLTVMATAAPIVLNIGDVESEVAMFFLVLVVAVLSSFEPNRTLVTVCVVGVLVVLLTLALAGPLDGVGIENWFFGVILSWGYGEIAWGLRATIDELEKARAQVADQGAVRERQRIARDVHDLVGHSLSVVMLHITGARHLVRKDPDEAERALEQAENAGRQSLAEIRRTIGLLREPADADDTAEVLPSPDLTDVERLIGEFSAAGLTVDLDVSGALDAVEPAIGLAGYRIVQEALTNASRHAPNAIVTVSVHVDASRCEIVVRNTAGQSRNPSTSAGFGLVGMRERARSVGGSLLAGPDRGGWVVEASLPRVHSPAAR